MQTSAPYRPSLPRRPNAGNAPGTPGLCPFLGTSADPGTSLAFPSDSNHCFSTRLAVPISTIHQENYCLSAQYEACPVYQQHTAAATNGPLLPLTAVAVAGSSGAWEEPGMPVASRTAAGTGTTRPAPHLQSAAVLDWNDAPHPDFQADAMVSAAPARRVSSRWVWLGLLLLALIPVGWWLWTNALPGSRGEPVVGGAIVTLPTLAATAGVEDGGASGGQQGIGAGIVTSTTDSGDAAVIAAAAETTATAEPTATDLENIAATATALFAGATVVAECEAPSWWVSYSTEAGDTIESLAAARGILPEELIVANCLAGPELAAGISLLLPPVGVVISLPGQLTPTPTAIGSATPTRLPGLPTRAPILLPTATIPTVVIIATAQPTPVQPTDEPPTRPPNRPTTAPTSAVQPTATPPRPFDTVTPPGVIPTSTPPPLSTGTPTSTPPVPTPEP